ncbi:hypothetical protein KKH24_03995, partial [Patescibacteria group bacterium]|nr:hypothetical protein [Patescibacteria group bacterium]
MNGNTTALLDILRDDPETAIALAARHGKLDQLFQAYVAEVQADRMEPNWRQFVYMVSSMPRSDWAQAYGRLVELALATNHRGMLLLALVENKRESRSVLACQDTFTPLFVQMTRAEVELVESWPHAVNTYYRHHISRFIERDDLKRAFDTVVEAIRAFCKSLGPVENDLHFVALDPKDPGTRNAVFAQRLRKHADNATLNAYIEMVWRAHRTAELVPDVSDDLMAWENTAKHVTYQYGQNCRGSKPLILEQTDA